MSETLLAAAQGVETRVAGGGAAYRVLFRSELLLLAQYRCLGEHSKWGTERHFDAPVLSLGFAGASLVHWGTRCVQADLTRAILHPAALPYTTSHPWGLGCRGVFVQLEPGLAEEILPAAPPRRAPVVLVATSSAHLRARRLVAGLAAGALDPLDVESRAVELARALLASARVARGGLARRSATRSMHARSVGKATALIQEGYRRTVALGELARAANTSPDHLLRLFRWEVGLSVHQYQLRLRLHAALDSICDSLGDLSRLAHELGFSSHSHFTAAFRAAFGAAPSVIRHELRTLSPAGRNGALDGLRQRLAAAPAGAVLAAC